MIEKIELKGDMDIITSIKGIGETAAIYLLSEMGYIKRFESVRKLIAYAGLHPTVYQSGRLVKKAVIATAHKLINVPLYHCQKTG